MFLKWTTLVLASLILIVLFAVGSLLFSKKGKYSTWDDFVPREKYFSGISEKENGKFESEGEKISRQCIESIFGVPFKNVRLPELINSNTGRNLEIDCYNEDLKIGLEYHGQNHYRFIPFFHGTNEKFKESQQRDKMKEDLCKTSGILLIVVPYTTRHDNICKFVKSELKKNGKMDHVHGWNDAN